jgi:RHS repeat-associated protein
MKQAASDGDGTTETKRGGPSLSGASSPPVISLPKGGGAIRGLGEKFVANPVTGSGSMNVPVYTSPGRAGFGPQLSLSYDSAAGNGVFGLGWVLALPEISRKTDKGLPQYLDGRESDVFVISGVEDLVPVLPQEGEGPTARIRTLHGQRYQVERFRPRVEGLFARIECWTRFETGETHWRSISRDNVTTLYGLDADARVADPNDQRRIFRWLISRSHDDKGNVIVYEYRRENSHGIERVHAHERNRTLPERAANCYPKRIRYGNRSPYFPCYEAAMPASLPAEWMFDVVFDYGEHDPKVPTTDDLPEAWPVRPDPFSSYRAGFEVRTYRRCRRILMFHHFVEAPEVGSDCLVRSTDLTYLDEVSPEPTRDQRFSLLRSVAQAGYVRTADGYLRRQLPPLDFTYSEAMPQVEVRELDARSQENLPVAFEGPGTQWADLDGEGLNGLVTEVAGAWFYKRNTSANNIVPLEGGESTMARFGALELVAELPSIALAAEDAQLLDLTGSGRLSLVALGGPMRGFFERTKSGGWEAFKPLSSLPVLDWHDPNVRFVDLTGDGRADILVTDDEVFSWFQSRGEEGFEPASKVPQSLNEENGPRVVFADRTQSLHLADMSGDGLADVVRVRNGEVCYWPNLGYGRFGAKVTMDGAPWLAPPDQFDPRRVRLADLDGSGPTDLVYLGDDGVQLFLNGAGNCWIAQPTIRAFPPADQLSSVSVIDLLGNGTACLVWSSSRPNEVGSGLRYIQLIGETKPHLLTGVSNNLGAETQIVYAPSTKFYLQDQLAGRPWITRLPFPVPCVEKVTVTDKWRGTTFSATYSYHHGYYDGDEREFRGFGRVEQVDAESYGRFTAANAGSPYIADETLYQPPVKTITWFHTGAFIDSGQVLSQMADEYFPRSLQETTAFDGFDEHALPEPELEAEGLSADEWREALRACKGMMLRRELYELDVAALTEGRHRPVKVFSTASHNYNLRCLQRRGPNPHAVFLVTESEAITYHYELALDGPAVTPDPRVAHTLNVAIDELGNVLESVAVAYPRLAPFADDTLADDEEALIDGAQRALHVLSTENRFTDDIEVAYERRLRLPCETSTYELTGFPARSANQPFAISELRRHREGVEKRLVEQVRTLYLGSDLETPLPLGLHGTLGLPFESYKLALTRELAQLVLGERFTSEVEGVLADATSGYLTGDVLASRFQSADTGGQFWISGGIVGFTGDARAHFYLPARYTDPFGQETVLQYDPLDLYVESSRDPKGNVTGVRRFDYRLLAPREIIDLNGNLSQVAFDALGLPAASAFVGKGEGDRLTEADVARVDPDTQEVIELFSGASYDEDQGRAWLGGATVRHLYDLGQVGHGERIAWGQRPAGACAFLRETHASEATLVQAAFEYSDGSGNLLVKKMQAEPEEPNGPLRWIASGRTVFNNKGRPVKQYEPSFSDVAHRFEPPDAVGVTPLFYYDSVGRQIRIEAPDGSYSRVTFSPWESIAYDQNDVVAEDGNAWRARIEAGGTEEERRALRLALDHADTPTRTVFDTLGRAVASIAHNRAPNEDRRLFDTRDVTFTRLDIEGNPLWIRDARRNLVMQYVVPALPDHWSDEHASERVSAYDLAGNLMFQHSMDAGERWMLSDAGGNPLFAWDLNDRYVAGERTREERCFRSTYDELRRPIVQQLRINGGAVQVVERFVYGEGQDGAEGLNLRGQLFQHYDASGMVTNVAFDFKGNVLTVRRQLVRDHRAAVVAWPEVNPEAGVLEETFTKITEYDALGRMTRLYNWHSTERVAVYEPQYSRRGLLESEDLIMRAQRTDDGFRDGQRTTAVHGLTYNARGQRTCLKHGNGTTTRFAYDPLTFRLLQIRTTGREYDPPFPREADDLDRGRVLQLLRYTYDPSGNITEIYDDAFEPVFFRNQEVRPNSQYTYDALYQLVEASGREDARWQGSPIDQFARDLAPDHFPLTDKTLRTYTQRYFYDQAGNITQMRHISDGERWRRNYAYAEDSNRLRRTWFGDAADAAVRYEYDLHGSMLNLANVERGQWMSWDCRDMIQALDVRGVGQVFYQYDSRKERTRKRIDNLRGGVEDRLYLGGLEVFRRVDYGGSTVEHVETHHLFVDDQRVLLVDDVIVAETGSQEPRPRYSYGDHLGSSVLELDGYAVPISYEEYHPGGTTAYEAHRIGESATAKRYRYTGAERDEESGLGYHVARYYAPWLVRWVTVDPIGIAGDLNCYCYCENNPILLTDAMGLQAGVRRFEMAPGGRRDRQEGAERWSERAAARRAYHRAWRDLVASGGLQSSSGHEAPTIRRLSAETALFSRPMTTREDAIASGRSPTGLGEDPLTHIAEIHAWEGYHRRLRIWLASGAAGPEPPAMSEVRGRGALSAQEALAQVPSYQSAIYLRVDTRTGARYIGRVSARGARTPTLATEIGLGARQHEHAEQNSRFYAFYILELVSSEHERMAEEYWIRIGGGPRRYGGGLENYRYEMNAVEYERVSRGVGRPIVARPTSNTSRPSRATPRPVLPVAQQTRAQATRATSARRSRTLR